MPDPFIDCQARFSRGNFRAERSGSWCSTLGKVTYAFDKKNSEKIKGWLSTPAAQTG